MRADVPERLLRRLDDLGGALAARGDALALLGLGSVGADLARLDEHSDMDFFVVVDEGAKQRYLDSINWLEAAGPVVYSFENTVDGRKALFADGLFAEYAIFTLAELQRSAYTGGRVVWRRDDAPDGLEQGRPPERPPHSTPEWELNEALTNLYVGLHRELRGERLSATRLIQSFAVERILTFLELTASSAAARQDPFAVERGIERRWPRDVLPLAAMVAGYERNREAALAILEWLEGRTDVDRTLAAAIRELARGRTRFGAAEPGS